MVWCGVVWWRGGSAYLLESLATDAAHVGLDAGVEALVADEVGGVAELSATHVAHLGLDAEVQVEVHLEVVGAVEGLGAQGARVRLLLVVH